MKLLADTDNVRRQVVLGRAPVQMVLVVVHRLGRRRGALHLGGQVARPAGSREVEVGRVRVLGRVVMLVRGAGAGDDSANGPRRLRGVQQGAGVQAGGQRAGERAGQARARHPGHAHQLVRRVRVRCEQREQS